MSSTPIPAKVANALWAKAGGRCQFRGCNKLLIGDLISGKKTGKFGYIAHVVADEPGGPRGDTVRSPLLAQDIDNLMLMCPVHHKAIDVDYLADYPEDVLLAMKAEHEDRIEIVTNMDVDRVAHVVRFAANIGQRDSLVTTRAIFSAMPPDHHPAEGRTIDIELIGSERKDHEQAYWTEQNENLERLFARKIKERIEQREIRQLSVFALAPQPLLIRLGTLLGDIVPVSVHQKHREPDTWKWLPDQPRICYQVAEYNGSKKVPVALKLALSAIVNDDRITSLLGQNTAIWSITCEQPGNDIMRRKDDLAAYKKLLRNLFDKIKAHHGEGVMVHVFPAVPASVALETGRVWMPKADLAMKIYDQNRTAQAFVPTILIGGEAGQV
ncbi:SAVED domain-containing protein [uncultured Agrobacterium sp.]|uniref:SAVED domain-containing protein n=1 Tax=uncultured Agrobacterium sp. TaxID=157277 RepID=UPI0025EF2A3E|nr:SAVED domain-containing protein [uncultured Agrobacterium sp.]